jgi:3',5'-cyclic AMP phosphodiesterase CpdA
VRIIHLSDLHFGRHDADLGQSLAVDIARQEPDLIVISGDFTQIGSRQEFAAAGKFLEQLPAPVFAVPGNHDVPARNPLLRFLHPYRRYREFIESDLEPFLQMGDVAVVGVKTSRRFQLGWNWANGAISNRQLRVVEEKFGTAPQHAVRIVVAHHPLLQPEQPMVKPMRLVKGANEALEQFHRLDVRLVMSGHFHLSYMRRHELSQGEETGNVRSASTGIILLQAASAVSTRLREGRNAYNVVSITDGNIAVEVRQWDGTEWLKALPAKAGRENG